MIPNTITQVRYAGNGSATVFAFPNKIFAATDLVLLLINDSTGLTAPLALSTDYTVQNIDADTGCSITTTAAPAVGYTLDIRTVTSLLQQTSIKNQGSFLPELHEEAFDRLTREVQDLSRRTYTYGIHGPDNEAAGWPTLPGPSARKGLALIFDPISGLPTVGATSGGGGGGTLPTQAQLGAILYPQTPAEIVAGVTPVSIWFPPYDLRRYGVIGDNTADDTAALNAVGSTATWNVDVTFTAPPAFVMKTTDTVTFKSPHCALMMDPSARIAYAGPPDRACLVLGADAGNFNIREFNVSVIFQGNANNYSSTECSGVQMRGSWNANRVRLNLAQGFTRNWSIYATSPNGIAYNTFDLGLSFDAVYHLELRGIDSQGFINENLFINGDFQISSQFAVNSAAGGANTISYGVVLRADPGGYFGHNKNHFIKPCFQLGGAAVAERIPIIFSNAGGLNQFQNIRVEGCNGEIVRVGSNVNGPSLNTVDIGYVNLSFGNVTAYMTETDNGFSSGNVITLYGRPTGARFNSGNLMLRAFAPTATTAAVTGMFFQLAASGIETAFATAKIGKDYVLVPPNTALGTYVDTSYYKNFTLVTDTYDGRGGRPTFTAFDAAGNQVTSTRAVMFGNGPVESASYGGHCYGQGADTNAPVRFRVDSGVASIKILFGGATNYCMIRSFDLTAYPSKLESNTTNTGLSVYGGNLCYKSMVAPAIPTKLGPIHSNRGDEIKSSVAAAAGITGWQCTLDGYNAPDWGALTLYKLNQIVNNDTGKIYVVAVEGTTGNAGGPVGTTQGIVDGSVTWNYVATGVATWTNGPSNA